ncbi:MAG: hypothetical protein AAGA60_09000 [Cyanobacteria bacterium P01_E01_bin.42]
MSQPFRLTNTAYAILSVISHQLSVIADSPPLRRVAGGDFLAIAHSALF